MVKYPESSKWFREKYFKWEKQSGRPRSVSDFSEYLDVSQPTGSAYINGSRKPNYENAIKICQKLNDDSLLTILNYSKDGYSSVPVESLPGEMRLRLISALEEIRKIVNEKSLDPESPEAKTISEEVLKKHGFIVNSNLND